MKKELKLIFQNIFVDKRTIKKFTLRVKLYIYIKFSAKFKFPITVPNETRISTRYIKTTAAAGNKFQSNYQTVIEFSF